MRGHPRHPTSRPARDTVDILHELGIDSSALAREVRRAAPWGEWLKLVPIYVLLAGGFAAVAVKWDRAVSDTELGRRVNEAEKAAEQRARALEIELAKVSREALGYRSELELVRTEAFFRLTLLEQRAAPRKRR